MAFYRTTAGVIQHVALDANIHQLAHDKGVTVAHLINQEHRDVDTTFGSAFNQMCASEGLAIPAANDFGIRPAKIDDILNGNAGAMKDGVSIEAAGQTNNSNIGSPFGSAARVLFPVAVLDMVETILQRDRLTDGVVFDQMIAQDVGISGDNFIQPVVDYQTAGGPESVKPQRVSEFGEAPALLMIKTSERLRSIPAFTMGIEFSDKARKSLTIDTVALTIARYIQVEKDNRVYGYMSALFNGDNDLITGAIPAVTSNSLDSNATGGVLTHRAWVKFLARSRKYRRITHIMCDIDTYLKIEGRTGRPGSNNYDPTLARIDPQALPINQTNIGFGNDVKFFITDSIAEGGPIPANTVWAIDATKAIMRITNTEAAYSASVEFALRRSTAMRWDYGETVARLFGDTELRPFDALTIS